jgi:CBS domain-containing protein
MFARYAEDTMRKLSDVTLKQCPLTMNETASVMEACNRMRDGQAGSILVTGDTGRLVGIFTGRDAVCRVLAQRRDAATTRLAEVPGLGHLRRHRRCLRNRMAFSHQ